MEEALVTDAVIISASRKAEKIIDAPASVSVLSESEKMAGKKMCLCVSRAKMDKLVIDI